MKRLSQIEQQPTEWLIRRMLPKGRIVLVAGKPEQGKSTFTSWLAAEVTKLGHNVIFSNFEDDVESVTKPRLVVAGALERRVFIPPEPYIVPNDIDALERKVKQIGAVLAVFDAANQHLGPSIGAGQRIRKAITPLREMTRRTGCTVVFVDHLLKRGSGQQDPLAAFAGASSGLPAAVRLAYAFGRNPADPNERVLAAAKANELREKPSFLFEMEDAATFTRDGKQIDVGRLRLIDDDCTVSAAKVVAHQYLGKGSGSDKDELRGAIATEWLIGTLMFGPRLASEVKAEGEKAGFSLRTLQRQAGVLDVKRNRVDPVTMKPKSGKGSAVLWSLPEGHPALDMAASMGGAVPTAVTP